jgi:O-antigen/teichoic acid export membrane protein
VRRLHPRLANVTGDVFYRSSGLLVVNLMVLSGLGFVFWTVAAHLFSAPDVGVMSGWVAACTLLATVGGLGLANTLIRHLPGHDEPRRLIVTSAMLLASAGALLCAAALFALPSVAPAALDLQTTGNARLVVLLLIIVSALSGLVDATLVASQAVRPLIVKNVLGGVVRVALLVPLADAGVTGLLIAYTAGAVLAALVAWRSMLAAYVQTVGWWRPAPALARPFLGFSAGNYVGTVVGILPATAVPLIVLGADGPTAAAHFGMAFLLVGFLNFLPSSIAQAYFAQASRPGNDPENDLRRAIRTSYAVMLPACAVFVLAAPLVLRIFGPGYAEASTGPMRVLTIAGLATALTYLVDSALNVQHRPLAYGAMNAVNAVLVVGGVAFAVGSGLTAVAVAWLVAQALSALIGVVVLRHPRRAVATNLRRTRYAREGT